MAKTKKDWSNDRQGAYEHIFMKQVPDHVKSQANSGSEYNRPYNKTKRSKGIDK